MARWLSYRRDTPVIDPKKACLAAFVTIAMAGLAGPANAASLDSDRDGIPNRWETTHKLNPFKASDAAGDPDHDRLSNLREYRLRSLPRDEDSDNDGQDDGDESASRTKIRTADSDGDGRKDGDEDYDHDKIANEDEDDATETCAFDDDDRDRDNVDDEDENELRLKVGVADSDGDGISDGGEDRDRDGVQNEDEDDNATDKCSGDRDSDGHDDEDEGDRFATITSYDDATGALVVKAFTGVTYTFTLTADTELEWEEVEGLDCPSTDSEGEDSEGEDSEGSDEASVLDLQPGQVIVEVEVEDGTAEEIELLRTTCA